MENRVENYDNSIREIANDAKTVKQRITELAEEKQEIRQEIKTYEKKAGELGMAVDHQKFWEIMGHRPPMWYPLGEQPQKPCKFHIFHF